MQGAPIWSEHTRSNDLTPPPQHASKPVNPSPPFLPVQPEPPQDPQLAGQQTLLAWMPGIPLSQVDPTKIQVWKNVLWGASDDVECVGKDAEKPETYENNTREKKPSH